MLTIAQPFISKKIYEPGFQVPDKKALWPGAVSSSQRRILNKRQYKFSLVRCLTITMV